MRKGRKKNMTEQQYEKISKPFRVSERRKQALILSNRMATLLVYAAYPAALVAAYQYSFRHLLISILVPGAAFILLSAFRSWYHAPRPYEKLSIDPIIKKDTKGKSFPSRHVFSAFMIDMVIFSVSKPIGIIYLFLAILIGIVITSVIGIPMGVTTMADTVSFREACAALPTTVGVIFTPAGLPSLFADMTKLPMVLITILAFSVSDTFDTIGAFIGTGIQSGIFSKEDEKTMENSSGFKSKMDKALFADAAATSIGALFGTSNTTTYVESAAGIAAGGRTGLTSVVVAVCFALGAFLATFVSAIPYAATAPALVSVGVMMTSAFKEINWEDFEEAVPAFFASLFMTLCYSISDGIAFGFITYCLVKICKKEAAEVHPILWAATFLFILNFVLLTFI